MIKITVENSKGKQLCLTDDENKYQLESVLGLNPPSADIAMSDNIEDGADFVHSRIGTRNIVINLVIKGYVEENRLALYKYFPNKENVKLYFETNTKKVWIDGYVESNEPDQFSMLTTCQISILCPNPFFKDLEETLINMNIIAPKFYFPFYTVTPRPFSTYSQISILNLINEGNVSSGMTIEISARGEVINPTIYNRDTKEYIGVGTAERPFIMMKGDTILITTHINNKRVKLIRNAVETNIFNYLKKGSKFLQLETGDNVFTYSAESGNEYIDIDFKYYSNYEGI
jgi:predicted phage tail component-like protein